MDSPDFDLLLELYSECSPICCLLEVITRQLLFSMAKSSTFNLNIPLGMKVGDYGLITMAPIPRVFLENLHPLLFVILPFHSEIY